MIEGFLLQWGVLGAWTASLIYEKMRLQVAMDKLVENNTIALTRVYEVLRRCDR